MSTTDAAHPAPNLATALALFQRTLPSVAKSNTARIPGKEGKAGYAYDYADLTDVSAAILPALAAQGLAWLTALDTAENGALVLKWELMHGASGESVSGSVPVGRPGEQWQTLGSSVTYARRYCLIAVTGVAPGGDDNDGADARAGAAPEPRRNPVAPAPEHLPAGLYELGGVADVEAARAMFRKARAAGHLALLIGVPTPDGGVESIPFGKWLTDLAKTLEAEDADAAAIAAHEAELAATKTERDGMEPGA
jgi:hypothetical protein